MGLHDRIARIRRSHRARLQFGLRSLLAAMLVVCLALGWYVEHVRRQQLAVTALREAGANLEYHDPDGQREESETFAFDGAIEKQRTLAEWIESLMPERLRAALGIDFFRRVESVDVYHDTDHARALPYLRDLRGLRSLSMERVLDEDLAAIATLSALTTLDLGSDSAITDAGLAHLGQLRDLECLKLPRQPITDAGLEHLARLKRLKVLDLSEVSVGDTGLRRLSRLPSLEFLDLTGAKITDDGLAALAGLRRLKHLDVSRTAIEGADLSCLAHTPDLEFLGMSCTGITDESLAPLRSLSRLKELDVSGTQITDKGLFALAELTSLESVYLGLTAVTPDGVTWLEKRLPQYKAPLQSDPSSGADLSSLRAVFLLRAGRWREALDAIGKLDDGTVPPNDGSFSMYSRTASLFYLPPFWARARGRCYAELGEWDQAEGEYLTAFERLSHAKPGYFWVYNSSSLWHELENWPRLAERVARKCPEDAWRWVARAERAVVDGHWEAAADNYARASVFAEGQLNAPANDGGYTRVVFDYGASRLLAGDLPERGRVCDRLLEAESRGAVKDPPSDNLFAAVRLSILAPSNAVDRSVIERACHWDCWWINDLLRLIKYRRGRLQEVLEHWQQPQGLDWLSMAMAYRQLGRVAEARASFARGARSLDRNMRIAHIRGDFDDALHLLSAEVLRREAERLIFK